MVYPSANPHAHISVGVSDSSYHGETRPLPYHAQLQDNWQRFMNPNSPAMNPALPPADNSLPIGTYLPPKLHFTQTSQRSHRSKIAGRGLSAHGLGGGYIYGGGMDNSVPLGAPMEPLIPPHDNSRQW
jgi:rhodanese-related sulfurtransferase